MSYHFLGDINMSVSASTGSGGPTSDDLSNPNSSYWLGPRCSGGQSAREVLEYQLFNLCKQHGAGTAQPDDNTVNPVLGKPNTWSKSGRCSDNGARVRAEATCGVVGANGLASQAVTSAYYSPPGSTPPAPPLPTQKCPNGPPQPQGKCCPAGYVGTAPVCTPVEVAKTLSLADLLSGKYAQTITTFTGPAGRPGPAQTSTNPVDLSIFQVQPTTTFSTAWAKKPGLPTAVVKDDGEIVTIGPPPSPPELGLPPRQKWFVGACVLVAVVSVGAMGYAYYTTR